MQKQLPARPNLDHLRRQAKTLLASLEAYEEEAIATLLKHLPTAKGKTAAQVIGQRYRLADAQWAIARKTGFSAWPHLARHVEQLRALEGTWSFARLELDGEVLPPGELQASRILIDGDRFRTESPEGTYEGLFNINVESKPQEIDILFVAGPEAGNTNHGIFLLEGDRLDICLDLNGRARPQAFSSSPGSGHAYESLHRTCRSRPQEVTGGTPPPSAMPTPATSREGFEFTDSSLLRRLQGEWKAVLISRDGEELPSTLLRSSLRTARKNEVTIAIGGRTMIQALIRLQEDQDPTAVDYYNLEGAAKGTVQKGILKWEGPEVCFCMAAPGESRPVDFTCPRGSGRTLSRWRLKAET